MYRASSRGYNYLPRCTDDKFIHVLPVEHPFYIRRYVGQVLWSLARNLLAIMLFLRSNSVSARQSDAIRLRYAWLL